MTRNDAGSPWKNVFGGHDSIPSIADGHLAANVIPFELWWRLPTAVLMYQRGPATAKQDPRCADEAQEYCVVPAVYLTCARELAPDHAFPVPGFKLGVVLGKELRHVQQGVPYTQYPLQP